MPALQSRNYRQQGFTMIELLVVILIIGLLAGVATVAIFSDSDNTQLQRITQRLQADIELMAEEAQLQGINYGLLLSVDDDEQWSYSWRQQLEPDERKEDDTEADWWLPLDQRFESLFIDTALPVGVELELRFDGSGSLPLVIEIDTDENELLPQIFFYSNGEITPFELQLINEQGNSHFELQGDMLGRVTMVDKLNEDQQ